uniref:Succinate-CoA ligase GDP-forming beta subunit n=1 Tax=Pavo cristatus TaxID=9049 RepID=A0A8C9FEZ4_PAVCR
MHQSFVLFLKAVQLTPRRWLNLQEYQSKKLMADHGVTVQRFFVADSADDALEAAQRLSKVKFVNIPDGQGHTCSSVKSHLHLQKNLCNLALCKPFVMVAEALNISRETYFAILMDRACNGPVMVGSPQGGVDIEEVAVTNPELIFKYSAMVVFQKLCLTVISKCLYVVLYFSSVVCFDAKINFDDNAEFRQKEIFAMDDKSENEPIENEAAKYDLKYIGLDGNIACFVNGAGLAMATCDIISLNGGKPANFLDLGGGVKEAQVYQAFKLLTADPKVEAILVNIFGGIVNCAIIANGITKACRELELKVPLVVRLEGTNVHEAQRILNESGLPITSASDLEDAAKKAVASVAKK